MKAIWRGQVIAESERTLEVHSYRYFPRARVRMDLLPCDCRGATITTRATLVIASVG